MSDGARVSRNFTLKGTWTPTLTFTTPGNLSVVYDIQWGRYVKIGLWVWYQFRLNTSTFTHTTASGSALITGLPFTVLNLAGYLPVAASMVSGYTKANYTQIAVRADLNQTRCSVMAAGSGQVEVALAAADFPTGGVVGIYASGSYEAA